MILMRHGQSEFNLHFTATKKDPGIQDPCLTQAGQAQAARAAAALAPEGITRIVVSPYTRALQTAAPVVRALGVPVRITPVIRERFHFACDIGSPRSVLAQTWPEHDFATLDEIWWPAATESAESTAARAAAFLAEMQGCEEWRTTLVVSHWAFLLALSGESLENGQWMRLP